MELNPIKLGKAGRCPIQMRTASALSPTSLQDWRLSICSQLQQLDTGNASINEFLQLLSMYIGEHQGRLNDWLSGVTPNLATA